MVEKRREGEGKREGRKGKGREGKGERKGRKEKGREGKGKRERKKKKEEKEEKRRGKTIWWLCHERAWVESTLFFFLLNNYQVIPFRGNPLSGQRNPFKGGGVIRHPFGGLGLETGQKGCHPLLKGVALF